MITKKNLLVVFLIAALITLFGVLKIQKTRISTNRGTDFPPISSGTDMSLSDMDLIPANTKAKRSRALIPPTPEELEADEKLKELRLRMINNARQIGLALLEFETEYGSFPNEETAATVKAATRTEADLKATTANDCMFQLIAAGIMHVDEVFSQDKPGEKKDTGSKPLMNLEKCAFAYLSGMNASGDPRRPLIVFPMIPGTGLFDRKAMGGKAVILRMDNSATLVPIEQDGAVLMDGMDLFDPAQPFWKSKVPPIRWPEK
jgi:hypothetical protein